MTRELPAASIRTAIELPPSRMAAESHARATTSTVSSMASTSRSACVRPPAPPLVRVHSECLTGDVLGSLRCDCGLSWEAVERITDVGGHLLYLRQEGRGIGLYAKARRLCAPGRRTGHLRGQCRLRFRGRRPRVCRCRADAPGSGRRRDRPAEQQPRQGRPARRPRPRHPRTGADRIHTQPRQPLLPADKGNAWRAHRSRRRRGTSAAATSGLSRTRCHREPVPTAAQEPVAAECMPPALPLPSGPQWWLRASVRRCFVAPRGPRRAGRRRLDRLARPGSRAGPS